MPDNSEGSPCQQDSPIYAIPQLSTIVIKMLLPRYKREFMLYRSPNEACGNSFALAYEWVDNKMKGDSRFRSLVSNSTLGQDGVVGKLID